MKPTAVDPPNSQLAMLPWILSGAVCTLAIIVWGESFSWHFKGLSTYQIFPVLGLLAFSLMWSHYMAGLMRRTFLHGAALKPYFNRTGYVVLILILLHPGLLAYQRFRDGFGLPPSSETSYVAPARAWIVMLGVVSLSVFLAFELRRWFSQKHWWFVVPRLGDVAMLAIFYHGLELGTQTHISWFRKVWWFYGIALVLYLVYRYSLIIRHKDIT